MKVRTSRPWLLTIVSLAALAVACSGGGGGDDDDDDDDDDVAADCSPRCTSRALGCGAPQEAALSVCGDVCATQPSDAQLLCLEASSCEGLAPLFEGDPICGIGGGGGPTEDGGADQPDAGETCVPILETGCVDSQCCELGAACSIESDLCCYSIGTPCTADVCCPGLQCRDTGLGDGSSACNPPPF